MFRAEIYINNDKIDEIKALNLGRRRPINKPDEWQYEVKTNNNLFIIYDTRKEGWEELLIKILKKMKGERNK